MDKKPEKVGRRHLPILSFWASCYLLRLSLDRRFGNRVLAPRAGVRSRILTAYMLAGMRLTSKEGLAMLLADDAACGLLRLQVSQFVADWKVRAKAQRKENMGPFKGTMQSACFRSEAHDVRTGDGDHRRQNVDGGAGPHRG